MKNNLKEEMYKAMYNRVLVVKDIMANLDYRSEELRLDNIVDYVVVNACDFYNTCDEEIDEDGCLDSNLDIFEIKNNNEGKTVIISGRPTGEVYENDLEEVVDEWQVFLPKTKLCMNILKLYYGDIDIEKFIDSLEEESYYGISKSCAKLLNKIQKQKASMKK